MLDIRKILIVGLSLRVVFMIWTIDLPNLETWEYGAIAENLANGKGYSLFYHENSNLEFKYDKEDDSYPSAYMPPGYVALITPLYKIISDVTTRNLVLLLINLGFDCLTMYLIYRFSIKVFNENIAIASAVLLAVFPQFIVLSTKVGTGSVFLCLSALLFNLVYDVRLIRRKVINIGLILALMTYLRSEALLFTALILLWLVIKKESKSAAKIALIILLLLFPWQLRNYYTFGEPVSLTTSSGLNLYRGNNPYYPGFWSDDRIDSLKNNLGKSDKYEVKMDKLYKNEAIKYIQEKPIEAAGKIPVKLFNLWGFDYHDSRTMNPVYLFSHFCLLGLFILGVWNSKNKYENKSILLMYIVFFTINCTVFFALPRYQVMMELGFVPFAGVAIMNLYDKNKFKKLGYPHN